MKRVSNLYPAITQFSNLLIAAKKAQRCKRFKPDILKFNYALETELIKLQEELVNQTYIPGEYHTFRIIDPKPRFISAAPYRDRVVHHALCNIITPIFEKTFIPHSYSLPALNLPIQSSHKYVVSYYEFVREFEVDYSQRSSLSFQL